MRTRTASISTPSRCSSSALTSSSTPLGGGREDTVTTGVSREPTARSAAARSRRARIAAAPMSAFVTTRTSGTSLIPAFRNCSVSPEPGCTTTATLSQSSATSVSDCPTPTVSTTTTSKQADSACAASRVASANPPRRVPAAVERIKTPSSRGSCWIRTRSPSSDPPETFEDGSTARTATLRPLPRHSGSSADSSDGLPAPGGPVRPIRWDRGSIPASSSSARACSRPRGERSSMTLSAAGAALRSPSRKRRPSEAPSGSGRCSVALGDEVDDVAHDLRDLEVLRGVDASDAVLEELLLVGHRDDPADDHRHVGAGLLELPDHVGDQLHVRPGKDRQADHVDAFVDRRLRDLGRRQADALVHHVEAGVTCAHGDLLGAVRVTVEARLADQDLDAATQRLRHALDLLAQLGKRLVADSRRSICDSGRSAVFAESPAQRGGPLTGRRTGASGVDRRRHDVHRLVPGCLGEFLQGDIDGRLVAL